MKKYKNILIIILILFGLLLIINILGYILDVKIKTIPNSTFVYDTNNNIIGQIVKDGKYRHIQSKYEEFPIFFVNAIIAIEDKSFWSNNGISRRSLARATYNNFKEKSVVQGGSTISAQLIRNSYGLNEKRTITKKINEFWFAYILNKQYSKKEIISNYLNLLYFGNLCYGPQSASKFYFNKDLSNLTKAEQIALITIAKNSEKYNPLKNFENFQNRYNLLIQYLYNNKVISEEEYILIKNEKILFSKNQGNLLPYFTDFLLLHFNKTTKNTLGQKDIFENKNDNFSGNSNVYTTINYYMSKDIQEIADSTLSKLAWKGVNDYGIIILDKKDLSLKVMIGGNDYHSTDGQVNSTTALRQPGSTIKVFTYLLAFKNLGLEPNSNITDLPIHFKTAKGYSYTPKNYTLKYKGQVNIATALSESLNVPAVKTLDMIGIQTLLDFLKDIGISSLTNNAEYYGLALTLGVGEVSLYELTRAYSIFAKDGDMCEIKLLKNQSTNCKNIIEKKYIDKIVLILTNRFFKLNGFPINSNLDFPDRFVFVKTGTSREFKDNFAIGFTDNYIIGVWVGNKSGENMKLVTGVAGAGDIFKKIVYYLEPNSVINKPVILEKKEDKYIEITNPANKSIYKYDKYIPLDQQKIKLSFSTNYKYSNYGWILDGELIKQDFINITKGNHLLQIILYDGGKKITQGESIFEVK